MHQNLRVNGTYIRVESLVLDVAMADLDRSSTHKHRHKA